jgi:hypothetical protein
MISIFLYLPFKDCAEKALGAYYINDDQRAVTVNGKGNHKEVKPQSYLVARFFVAPLGEC